MSTSKSTNTVKNQSLAYIETLVEQAKDHNIKQPRQSHVMVKVYRVSSVEPSKAKLKDQVMTINHQRRSKSENMIKHRIQNP